MKVTISFQQLEHTVALDEKIHEKTEKLGKWMDGKTHVKWHCYVKDNQHYADVDLSGPQIQYYAHAFSDNLYKTIDMAVSKLEKQLSKKKEKVKNRIHRKHEQEINVDPEGVWTEYESDEEVA